MGSQGRLRGGSGTCAAGARPAGGSARDLSGLHSCGDDRSHGSRSGVRSTVLSDGVRSIGSLRSLRRLTLDAGDILWNRRGRDRDHCPVSIQADKAHHWERQVAVGNIRDSGDLHRMDISGNHLAFFAGRSRKLGAQSLTRSAEGRKRFVFPIRCDPGHVRSKCCRFSFTLPKLGCSCSAADSL